MSIAYDPSHLAASRAYAAAAALPLRPSQRLALGVRAAEQSEVAFETETGPYAGIVDRTVVGPGRAFSSIQKAKILAANRGRNGGVLRSDDPADPHQLLSPPVRSVSRGMGGSGQLPDMASVDHIVPAKAGGTNAYSNARVISQSYNNLLRAKGL
jgi:hypothetical protein